MDDNLMKKKIIIISVVVAFLCGGGYFLFSYYNKMRKETEEIITEEIEDVKPHKKENKEEISLLKVDIKGEVKKPNIYSATEEDRVIDIINKAGGLTKKADTSIINLSKKVKDEMVIIIYSKEQIKEYATTKEKEQKTLEICNKGEVKNDACISKEESKEAKEVQTGLININTATLEQLQTLPKVGESKAKNIISYREKNNGFKTIEEIKNVSGIGDSIFDQIKDYITI